MVGVEEGADRKWVNISTDLVVVDSCWTAASMGQLTFFTFFFIIKILK